MIWATWRMHRLIFLVSLGAAAVVAIWLGVSGTRDMNAWSVFASHHCSTNYPGRSPICMTSLQGSGWSGSINAGLCLALPGVLGLVVGTPLVAGEIQLRTNRLAWTQSITRTRWLMTKIGVGLLFTAVVTGALTPLIWWWTDAARRGNHIQPTNFDVSGFVIVAYAVFAFMLGVALGALIRRVGWAFAVGIPLFVAARLGVRDDIRPGLIAPTTATVDAFSPVYNTDWYLNAGFVPLGRSTPAPGQTWASNDVVISKCQDPASAGAQKPPHSATYCENAHHLHYVMQFQPPSHFWALQGAESALFLGAAGVLLGLTVVAVRRWRT